ncbi:hypothetical protein HK097_007531, partial [Rhizophlyctis rosea]
MNKSIGGKSGADRRKGPPGKDQWKGKRKHSYLTKGKPLPSVPTTAVTHTKSISADPAIVKSKSQTAAKDQVQQARKKPNAREVLRREILALGGEESDMDLLEDALSGSEVEDDAPKKKAAKPEKGEEDEKSILSELQSFLSGTLKLDPSKSVVPEITDEEAEAEDDEDGEAEEEGGEEEGGEEEGESDEAEDAVNESYMDDQDEEDEAEGEHAFAEKYGKEDAGAVQDMVQQMLSGKKVDDKLSSKMLVQPGGHWYAFPVPPTPGNIGGSEDNVVELYKRAQQLWEADVQKYEKSKTMSAADRDFIATVLKSGTVTDKVSALTLLIQESPVHSLDALRDQLVHGMARKKARREAILAIDSIKDLFLNNLLPDRKLRYFRDQPLLSPHTKNVHLVLWFFEDSLKKLYFDFIKLLEELSRDPLLHVKNKMLTYISDLLSSKPEQEQNLLALLVNKLGDLDRKLASKASHLLAQLLLQHPNMKLVVVREVERLLFRPNVGERARYYAVTFLNQVILSRKKEEESVANKLVEIYFAVFDDLVKQNKEEARKPASGGEDGEKEEKGGKEKGRWRDGKKGAGGKGGKGGKGAKGKKGKGGKGDSAEKTEDVVKDIDGIDAKMMAALLTGVNRAFPFAKIADEVFEKHLNTLFTISHIGTFNISIQSLTLIHQVQSSTSSVSDRFYRALYETLLDTRLYTASKQALYLNLLYRSLKSDTSLKRSKALIKRIVQTCAHAQVPFVCAGLFLIGEIMKGRPGLFGMCTVAEDDDDEERFVDAPDEDEEEIMEAKPAMEDGAEEEVVPQKENKVGHVEVKYDGRKRDPTFANADRSCLWELSQFSSHYHPTVALYAHTLLSGHPIAPPSHATNYDPLQNHTLSRFLDRFVFKNPKKVSTPYKGSSLMQPRMGKNESQQQAEGREQLVSGGKKRGVVFEDEEKGEKKALDDAPVTADQWLARNEGDVPVDELFFFKYFQQKHRQTKPSKRKSTDLMDIDDGDSVASDQDISDTEIWEAMRRSSGFPAGGEGGDEDDDLDMSMMEDDEEESDEEVVLGEEGEELEGEGEELGGEEDSDGDFEGMDEVFKKMDGFGEGSEDEEDEMAQWAEGGAGGEDSEDAEEEEDDSFDMTAIEDASEPEDDTTGAFKNDSLVKGGDEEFAKFFAEDSDASDEGSEAESSGKPGKPGQGKRKRAAAQKMAQKAKELGYSGGYFDAAGGLGGEFASADDFERLMALEEDEDGVGVAGGVGG